MRSCDRGPGETRHGLGRPRRGPQHAAKAGEGPRTGHGLLAGGCRSRSSGQGEREVPRPRQPHPHPHQSLQAVPPQALPPGAGAARPPPGARALAAGRHAAAAAKTAGRPARDPGRRGRRAGRAACQPRERGAQGWYHTVRVPFGIDTIQYSGVLYGIAQEAPLNVRIPWCYDIFKLIPTTKPLSQKHQKISTNICHHRPDAAFVLNLSSKCEWASIGGTLLWF